ARPRLAALSFAQQPPHPGDVERTSPGGEHASRKDRTHRRYPRTACLNRKGAVPWHKPLFIYRLKSYAPGPPSSFLICGPIASGFVIGAKRFTGLPFLSMRNLGKFHLIRLPNKPPSLPLRYRNTGCVPGPLTSIFSNKGNVTP